MKNIILQRLLKLDQYLQQLYNFLILRMSPMDRLDVCPIDWFGFGTGVIVSLPLVEKAVLEDWKKIKWLITFHIDLYDR